MPKIKNAWPANRRVKNKQKRAQELPEQTTKRLLNQREYQRKRLQNETLAEREERLRKGRWQYAQRRKSFKAREKRLQKAMIISQKKQEQAEIDRLMHAGQTFETTIWRPIRVQLHRTHPKVLRLSVTSIKHVHIGPPFTFNDDKTLGLIKEELTSVTPIPCSVEDDLNGEEEALLEPKCVLQGLSIPENLGPTPTVSDISIVVKTEPMTSDEEPNMIVGDLDVFCNVERRGWELDVVHQPMSIENDSAKQKFESVLKTDSSDKYRELPILKSEVNMKTEMERQDLLVSTE